MNGGVNEPIPYHLMAIFYQLKGNLHTSEKLLFQALELDPKFKPSLNMLLFKKCSKRIINYSKQKLSINQIYSPLCCWPNEQEIFCFKQLTTKNKKKTINCYRPEPLLESPLFNIKLIYFRCNTPYIGKSYLAPAFARFIIPLLFPAAKLREIKEDIFAKKLEAELAQKVVDRHKIEEAPVFPLDYGGYSLDRIRAHQRPIWPEGVKEQINQFQIDFEPSINNEHIFEEQNEFKLTKEIKLEKTTVDETIFNEYLKNEWTENNEKNKGDKKKQNRTKQQNNIKMTKEKSKVSDSIVVDGVTSSFLNNQSKRLKSSRVQIDGTLLGTLSNRGEVLFKLDIPLPELNHLFEQPVSTWVSPSAKGIKVDDLLNFGELPELADLLLEPECPEPTLVLQSSSILLELDELPAYLYREHLTKFYKPEKALRDTFRSIGSSKLDSIERVAAKLFFALKGAAMHPSVSSSKPISSIREFVLGTISSLYWRIKGDPLNSIKCLRHSLYNSPNEFIDVPLVSLANIYHQAGFLHSALYTLGKALETGKNVVAVHFTLANVYSTIGDFPHALQFYYSTLSLQSNFEPAKASITAIHCLTNGVLLND
uniref:TPR_REGION domain-containing protein n=1 Tax=Meloidogyne incognita TaxID=6306 RepID=A0A914LVY8_MELIC